jgi:hypothetical protein
MASSSGGDQSLNVGLARLLATIERLAHLSLDRLCHPEQRVAAGG